MIVAVANSAEAKRSTQILERPAMFTTVQGLVLQVSARGADCCSDVSLITAGDWPLTVLKNTAGALKMVQSHVSYRLNVRPFVDFRHELDLGVLGPRRLVSAGAR